MITDTQHKSLKLIPQSSEEIMICKAYQKRRLEYQKNIATSKEINNLLAFD